MAQLLSRRLCAVVVRVESHRSGTNRPKTNVFGDTSIRDTSPWQLCVCHCCLLCKKRDSDWRLRTKAHAKDLSTIAEKRTKPEKNVPEGNGGRGQKGGALISKEHKNLVSSKLPNLNSIFSAGTGRYRDSWKEGWHMDRKWEKDSWGQVYRSLDMCWRACMKIMWRGPHSVTSIELKRQSDFKNIWNAAFKKVLIAWEKDVSFDPNTNEQAIKGDNDLFSMSF